VILDSVSVGLVKFGGEKVMANPNSDRHGLVCDLGQVESRASGLLNYAGAVAGTMGLQFKSQVVGTRLVSSGHADTVSENLDVSRLRLNELGQAPLHHEALIIE
jgi:hypothetical protein